MKDTIHLEPVLVASIIDARRNVFRCFWLSLGIATVRTAEARLKIG